MGNYDSIVDYMYFACIKTKEFVSIEENYFVQHKSLQLNNCLLSEEE